MKGTEVRERILHDIDFVYLKRFDYSLKNLVARHPEGVPNRVIAAALMMTEEDVEDLYQTIIEKLRQTMKITL